MLSARARSLPTSVEERNPCTASRPVGDRLPRLFDHGLQCLLGFGRPIRDQIRYSVELQQHPLKTLQQRIVQIACDARPLGDSRVQRLAEKQRLLVQPKQMECCQQS
jgi:hypothetical protein